MRPTRYDLTLQSGDTVDLLFRLWTMLDGARVPFAVAPGEQFELALRWVGGEIVASTADGAAAGLALTQASDATTLARRLTAAETARLPLGRLSELTLARIPTAGQRRTWLTGSVTAQAAPLSGPGDTALDLTISDTAVVVEVTVDDAAAENTLAAALAAVDEHLDAFAAAAAQDATAKAAAARTGAISTLRDGVDAAGDTLKKLLALLNGLGIANISGLTAALAGKATPADISVAIGALTAALGSAAALNVGTAAGTVAAGDDSRLTGALQKNDNLSALTDRAAARDNLGLATVASTGRLTDASLTGLPTSLPAQPGVLWNNGGLLSIS